MKWICVMACLLVLTTGCANGTSFLSDIENAPKWFLDKIPESEAEGYPAAANTPPRPDDMMPLEFWEIKLAKLQSDRDKVLASERAEQVPADQNSEEFLAESLEFSDVVRFNEAEYAAEDAAAAAKLDQ
ncbi:MAG: hypothetical protein COA47_03500 [Robiginitomaculum sp.]|nr:MAG: hypothetical protein COA47_03500 [Robiginitomaculum sp.]